MQVATWLITGTSSGFGREWTEAALERGDRVAATARNTDALADLVERYGSDILPLELDVTDRERVFSAVDAAVARFGELDIVVNSAGYGQVGLVEELIERELREVMETNYFGSVWVTQAVLPVFRRQGHGRLMQVTSEGGVRAYPAFGAYHASKWAVEGIMEALDYELEFLDLPIFVTNVEPGPYATDFGTRGLKVSDRDPELAGIHEGVDRHEWHRGDPKATRDAILEIADAERPPRRVLFGRSLDDLEAIYADRLDTWRQWQPLALRAFGEEQD